MTEVKPRNSEFIILIYNGPQIAYIDLSIIPKTLAEIMKRLGPGTVTGCGGEALQDINSIDCRDICNLSSKDLYSIVRLAFMSEANFQEPKIAIKFSKKIGLDCSAAFDDKTCLCLEGMNLHGQNHFPINGTIVGIFGFTEL